jgi:hypothetical protein
MIDSTWCETVGVADFNRDAKLDLVACEYWYESPTWTPRKIRDINFNGAYVDNFSDLPLDVDGDGYVDVIQIAYFERRILWLRNPGRKGGPWTEHAPLPPARSSGSATSSITGAAPAAGFSCASSTWTPTEIST